MTWPGAYQPVLALQAVHTFYRQWCTKVISFIEIKADVYRIIRANSDKSAKVILKRIHEHFGDEVPQDVINKCLKELMES